jgi:hypothetical protein
MSNACLGQPRHLSNPGPLLPVDTGSVHVRNLGLAVRRPIVTVYSSNVVDAKLSN